MTGKAIGADRQRGKPTFTSVLGIERARAEAERLHGAANAALATLRQDTTLLFDLADRLVHRDA
jgi:hypothetical protein